MAKPSTNDRREASQVPGQLTGVDYGIGRTEGFAYDPAGNRTSAVDVGGVPPAQSNVVGSPRNTDYATNALNQYTQVGGVPLSYDGNGNLINDGKQRYAHDAQNRLISVQPSVLSASSTENVRAEFFYDARNRCVLRKYYTLGSQGQWILNNADSRALTYDTRWNLLSERMLTGSQAGKYIHGIRTDEILVSNLGSQIHYPLADGLGSTVALSDQQGRVTERYRYTAYGTPTILSVDYQIKTYTLSAYRHLFTGREWLDSVGLNDHRYRYCSPKLGRWLSSDPITFKAGDLNIYRYCNNNSTDYTDATGLLFFDKLFQLISVYGCSQLSHDYCGGCCVATALGTAVVDVAEATAAVLGCMAASGGILTPLCLGGGLLLVGMDAALIVDQIDSCAASCPSEGQCNI